MSDLGVGRISIACCLNKNEMKDQQRLKYEFYAISRTWNLVRFRPEYTRIILIWRDSDWFKPNQTVPPKIRMYRSYVVTDFWNLVHWKISCCEQNIMPRIKSQVGIVYLFLIFGSSAWDHRSLRSQFEIHYFKHANQTIVSGRSDINIG